MSERIDHAAEALKHIEWAHDIQEAEGETERTVTDTALLAQVNATLALAEQQRIANLIALHRHEVEYDLNGNRSLLFEGYTEEIRPDIEQALGI